MKKTRWIALLIAALTVLTMLPTMTFTASAVDIDGDWTTYRSADDYGEPDPETGEEPAYKPAPGYEYTSEGFTTIPADYTNTSPFFTVQSKEKHSLKDGLYLQFRVDEFSYRGEDGKSDEWIALSLWDRENLAPGTTTYGSGWICLLRGEGNGADAKAESCLSENATEDSAGYFTQISSDSITPDVDSGGREIYTLEVEWDGSAYTISICGVKISVNAQVTELLEKVDNSGDFHVGVTFHSGAKDGVGSMTILKYGTSERDAEIPVGSDSAQPEINNNVVADLMDASTVPANQPSVYWDAATYTNPTGSNIDFVAQGDNSYRVTALATNCFMNWSIKNNISYAAEDFPIFAMMVRDYWGGGTLWYCAGDVIGVQGDYSTNFGVDGIDSVYYDGDFEDYTLIIVDLEGMWEGRINSMRIDFNGVDMNMPEFDICYMGCFRSIDEAENYGNIYLGLAASASEETTEAPATEAPTEEVDETTAPAGEVDETTAVASEETSVSTDETDDSTTGGCASTVGMSAAVLLATAAATVALKKRK